jgi:hypothetical protein
LAQYQIEVILLLDSILCKRFSALVDSVESLAVFQALSQSIHVEQASRMRAGLRHFLWRIHSF